jgi:hypothetical protein
MAATPLPLAVLRRPAAITPEQKQFAGSSSILFLAPRATEVSQYTSF